MYQPSQPPELVGSEATIHLVNVEALEGNADDEGVLEVFKHAQTWYGVCADTSRECYHIFLPFQLRQTFMQYHMKAEESTV